MNKKTDLYHVTDLSAERRGMAAYLDLKGGRHVMYALLDVDVTLAKRFIEAHRAQGGEPLSFTGYLIYCLARALDEDRAVQAYRKGRRKLVIFNDVDVGFMVEMKKGEKRVLRGHVIRAAQNRTFRQIHQEIRDVQSRQVPAEPDSVAWFRSAMLLPWPFSSWFAAIFRWALRNDPTIVTSMAGTVGISSVGMFGKGHGGWGISEGQHPLDLVVGGIAPKLVEVNGRIENREMLSVTIIFDHEVIDGAPAARFTKRLVELIESGYGLEGSETAAPESPAEQGEPEAVPV